MAYHDVMLSFQRFQETFLRNYAIKVFFQVLFILSTYILYQIYYPDISVEETFPERFMEMQLTSVFKEEAGQITSAETIGAPHLFLNKRFPKWKEDGKTYMIPSHFLPNRRRHQIGITRPVPYSDQGNDGESVVYHRLRELGDVGMFVVKGFRLSGIGRWNKNCKNEDFLAPKLVSGTGECDFIIFHHQLGLISMEVKNFTKFNEDKIHDAEKQIETSYALIKKFAYPDESFRKDDFLFPHKKVIALPSTRRADFNLQTQQAGVLFLFAEDAQDISSFQKWWHKVIDNAAPTQMSEEAQEAYERALSNILMIRHMGPVTEADSIGKIHASLTRYKYRVIQKDKRNSVLEKEEEKELRESFMKKNKLVGQSLEKVTEFLDKLLKKSEYISGNEYSVIDDAVSAMFANPYCLFFKHTVDYIMKMRKEWRKIKNQDSKYSSAVLEKYPFLRLETAKDFNMLDRHLSRSSFINGDNPTEVDRQLFESLTCKMRIVHAHHPIIMTTEQLVVFEGPRKQLIIGPPGSGKTELMKFKALELATEMKNCNSTKKIMYILANGSPDYPEKNSLFFYRMQEFFSRSSAVVDVISVVLEEESAEDTEQTTSDIRRKINCGEYEHAFVDEYWIGSKPTENKIIQELVAGLPGYVWISSVFSYRQDMIKENKRMISNTQPVLTKLHENGGVVSYITQVMRTTNSIIELERDLSKLYENRPYPYPEQIIGHSYEGLPVTWAVENNVDGMYDRCVNIVDSAIEDVPLQNAVKRDKLTADPANILIVDFSIRMADLPKQSLLDRLDNKGIPVWTFNESIQQFMKCKTEKVTLLQSNKRSDSEFLDGVEWPMVVVILPSGMLLETAKLADGKGKLRNYDSYISLFRAMVKVVVISDKWRNKQEFLEDVEKKLKL